MLSLSAASFCRGDLVEVVDTYYTLRSDPKKMIFKSASNNTPKSTNLKLAGYAI